MPSVKSLLKAGRASQPSNAAATALVKTVGHAEWLNDLFSTQSDSESRARA